MQGNPETRRISSIKRRVLCAIMSVLRITHATLQNHGLVIASDPRRRTIDIQGRHASGARWLFHLVQPVDRAEINLADMQPFPRTWRRRMWHTITRHRGLAFTSLIGFQGLTSPRCAVATLHRHARGIRHPVRSVDTSGRQVSAVSVRVLGHVSGSFRSGISTLRKRPPASSHCPLLIHYLDPGGCW